VDSSEKEFIEENVEVVKQADSSSFSFFFFFLGFSFLLFLWRAGSLLADGWKKELLFFLPSFLFGGFFFPFF